MNITEITSVSPVNPAHGRHEVHAHTNEGLDITFTISPNALGCLTGYFNSFSGNETEYLEYLGAQAKKFRKSSPNKGS